jgi:hypothetical protein
MLVLSIWPATRRRLVISITAYSGGASSSMGELVAIS